MSISKKRREAINERNKRDPLERDSSPNIHGVLLSDWIEHYSTQEHLIYPFNKDQLKAGGYELSIGDEYYINGHKYSFDNNDTNHGFTIQPFEVAVIKTKEYIRLPRFMIARWNLRVTWAYKGLLWIGAAQVDPGYRGFLYCPIYNLSNIPVRLKQDEKIALIDFVKTTPYTAGKSENYPDSTRVIFEDYECEDLKSGLVTDVKERIDKFENAISSLDNRTSWFIFVVITLIGIMSSLFATDKFSDGIFSSDFGIFIVFLVHYFLCFPFLL